MTNLNKNKIKIDIEEASKDFLNGMTIAAISKKFNINTSTLTSQLKRTKNERILDEFKRRHNRNSTYIVKNEEYYKRYFNYDNRTDRFKEFLNTFIPYIIESEKDYTKLLSDYHKVSWEKFWERV